MEYDRFQDPRHIKWAKAVKRRDKFTCQICSAKNTYLNSHHKNSFDVFVDQRFSVDNGVCLCNRCHDLFHDIYGSGKNTEYQFEEFSKMIFLIRKVASQHSK